MSTITGVYVPINMRKYASAWAQVCHEAEANGKFCGFGLAAGENDATIPMIKWNIRTEREPLVGGFFQLWRLESTNRKGRPCEDIIRGKLL